MKVKLGRGYEPGGAWPTLGDLKTLGAELKPHTVVEAVTAEGVRTAEGTWPCDAVVMCVGTKPDYTLQTARAVYIPVETVGNAHRLGRAIDAIEAACELGLTI